ncbi:MAG: DUF721 domain-containing protein [Deltaproteobacteria bacterium]|nr:DUF721 domain-containing protein [Deltaproteobacteria bacterium]MBZ0219022.1 DUF721 domain-containing protein [Deltaproteobacteria bacterium]
MAGRGRERRRSPARSSPSVISSVLGSTLGHLNLGAKLMEYRAKKLWHGCVGEAISRRTNPERLIGTVLFCSVDSSPWMTELNYQKASIISRLNEALGPGSITDIAFRSGAVKSRRPAAAPELPPRHLTPEEESFIRETTCPIKDEKLKTLVEKVMKKGKGCA